MLTKLEMRADAEARHAHRRLVEALSPDTPTPEAVVRAAMERAADTLNQEALYWSGLREGVLFDREVEKIRALASDPETVAQIIEAAKGDQ